MDAMWAGGVSGAEPAADGAPGVVVIADDAECSGDWNGKKQAHAAPDPTPEEQRDGDRDGVEANASADQCWRDEVRSDHVDRRKNSRNEEKRAKRFDFC